MRLLMLLIISIVVFCHIPSALVHASTQMDKEYSKVIKHFLPKDAELLKPHSHTQTQPVQAYDFDQDGQKELIVPFKQPGDPVKIKVMILKKERHNWKKIWERAGEGFDIELSTLLDITGDGVKEYVVGWMVGASAGNKLEIFQWQSPSFKEIYDHFYHKMDILTKDHHIYLAIWDRFCCDAYIVDVIGWNGKMLTNNAKVYTEYYPKVDEFYKKKIEKMDAWFYWYALADAQIKANLLNEARTSIQKGLSFNLENKMFVDLQKELDKKEEQKVRKSSEN
ncbi:hypothetical protein V7112_15810 [Bacillus sp. JJ1566]|uniref:hypothetical protein n=1 Tax=Bacillus sp. JJ1566 TaxID=3122961 RepID=UPI002FFF70F2